VTVAISHEPASLGHWLGFWAFVVIVSLAIERIQYRREQRRRAAWREEQGR